MGTWRHLPAGLFAGRLPLWAVTLAAWTVMVGIIVWRTTPWHGLATIDTDDAMRLVQVRDLLAGQAWFDTVQHRTAPPEGLSNHWSRIGDIPLAALILQFRLFAPAQGAETLAAAVWPLLLLFVGMLVSGRIARSLGGPSAAPLGAILFALIGPDAQFFPYRVDHHALQLIGAMAAMAAVIEPGGRRRAAWAALAFAFTLGVGLETLPYLAVIAAVYSLSLLRRRAGFHRGLKVFGLGLAVTVPALALLVYPPGNVLSRACDQVAMPVLALTTVGGLGLCAAALGAGVVRSLWIRLLMLAGVAGAAAAAYLAAGPHCLAGPFAALDPAIADFWLRNVQESLGLVDLIKLKRPFAARSALVLALGAAALLWLLVAAPRRRWRLAMAGGVFLAAAILSFERYGASRMGAAMAGPLAGAAIALALRRVRRPAVAIAAAAAAVIVLGLAPYAAFQAMRARPSPAGSAPRQLSCLDARSYDRLRALAPGLAAAPVDSGPFILLRSRLSVLAAPYHRNGTGIAAAHRLFISTPGADEGKAREMGIRYVAVCQTAVSWRRLVDLTGQGLAARLDRGETPAWLTPVIEPDVRPVKVYEVVR